MRRLIASLVAGTLCLAGCHGPHATPATRPYLGPTDPVAKVVADVNANSTAIPTLWATHYFAGEIVDDRGRTHHVNTEGVLVMSKPHSVRMQGKKPGVTLFDLGTNGTTFWMSVAVGAETMWWGNNKNIGKPCAKSIPIQPEGIFEVLGVGEFDAANLNAPPVPVMRFDAVRDAYVFVWSRPLADHWAATKEVWFDRATKRPTLVLLYDDAGRVALRAELSDHKPVEIEGRPKDRWPWVARVYHLSFPETGSKITLSLDEVQLRSDGGAPTERSFVMPDPGDLKVVKIDEDCGK